MILGGKTIDIRRNKMAKKLTEFETAERVLTLMFDNEEVEDFVDALNQDPEVKAWLLKVLPHEGEL